MRTSALIERQKNRISIRINQLELLSTRYSWLRLSVIILAVFIGVLAIYKTSNVLAGFSITIILAGFGTLSFLHGRIKASIVRYQKLLHVYTLNYNRLKLNWKELPAFTFKAMPKHPYAFDLDISGDYSLLRLLDQTTTFASQDKLIRWLLQPRLERQKIIQRQKYVQELAKRTTFRHKIFTLLLSLKNPAKKKETEKLQNWLDNPKIKISFLYPLLLTVTGFANIILFILFQSGSLAPYWIYTFLVYVVIHLWGQLKLNAIFNHIFEFSDDIQQISKILKYIEQFQIPNNSPLHDLVLKIQDKKIKPSRQLKRLNLIISAIGLRMNPVMTVIMNILLPWDYYVAKVLEISIPGLKVHLDKWLEEWYTIDALSTLAQYAWLHKENTYPRFPENTPANEFLNGHEIGHPLIESGLRKTNSFKINNKNQLSLITGSNMSGKSTFLRTVGINLILAYAGAPVCARSLETKIFRLYSCIRINDSLSEGLSYFYAEVKRLKDILNALNQKDEKPLLFLIDEIFKGTNNRERLIGSLSYIKELSTCNGIGIISTHDLELANLEKDIKNLTNYHFREDIIDGKMNFDYILRSGPSPTTNALKIMKLEGLPVDDH